jgi:hypothetical protein
MDAGVHQVTELLGGNRRCVGWHTSACLPSPSGCLESMIEILSPVCKYCMQLSSESIPRHGSFPGAQKPGLSTYSRQAFAWSYLEIIEDIDRKVSLATPSISDLSYFTVNSVGGLLVTVFFLGLQYRVILASCYAVFRM